MVHLEQELVLVGVGQAVPLEDDEVRLLDVLRVLAELAPDELEIVKNTSSVP